MHAYVNKQRVEITPRFRKDGRGKTVTSASFNIPLRTEDLTSILYHCPLPTARLTEAGAVHRAIAVALLDRGAARIAVEKTQLKAALTTGRYDSERLRVVQQQIVALFQQPPRLRGAA